jgi:hypothetical protein
MRSGPRRGRARPGWRGIILDTTRDVARILGILLKARILRIGVTICAVMAVLALSILPATHLHRSISGNALIHSHLIDDPLEHAGTLDHGDHHGVRTFAPVFTTERTTHAVAMLAAASPVFLVTVERRSLGYTETLDAPVIHGPPLRIPSLRAPPA